MAVFAKMQYQCDSIVCLLALALRKELRADQSHSDWLCGSQQRNHHGYQHLLVAELGKNQQVRVHTHKPIKILFVGKLSGSQLYLGCVSTGAAVEYGWNSTHDLKKKKIRGPGTSSVTNRDELSWVPWESSDWEMGYLSSTLYEEIWKIPPAKHCKVRLPTTCNTRIIFSWLFCPFNLYDPLWKLLWNIFPLLHSLILILVISLMCHLPETLLPKQFTQTWHNQAFLNPSHPSAAPYLYPVLFLPTTKCLGWSSHV